MPARAPVCGQVDWISKLSTEIYCKIDCVWVLFFLLTALAWAQPTGAPKPVFPDDTQDPKQAGGAELLEPVCPGHVVSSKEIECKIVCPEFTAMPASSQSATIRVPAAIISTMNQNHFLSCVDI